MVVPSRDIRTGSKSRFRPSISLTPYSKRWLGLHQALVFALCERATTSDPDPKGVRQRNPSPEITHPEITQWHEETRLGTPTDERNRAIHSALASSRSTVLSISKSVLELHVATPSRVFRFSLSFFADRVRLGL
ncbi:uncharacterized protein L3040_007500 [Drepanopeziza brunnea f. sp. 'multigermtubi']|uniref:uncharacterized protein n=1 Tax=Drepanopeziza brunnea f. sp. 'multigermtubi' TaxID=698441 RepID=UPI00239D2A2D|nr:hypothetical protein L3040_007500 [Drepanopeziza brunnea f. sp. 'multigermtubi']